MKGITNSAPAHQGISPSAIRPKRKALTGRGVGGGKREGGLMGISAQNLLARPTRISEVKNEMSRVGAR